MKNWKTEYSRELRNQPTDAERFLWRYLRDHQIEGAKFRRQHPIGTYIVDFACLQKKVLIELDGGQHAESAPDDQVRDAWLKAEGYAVLRFWNHEVFENIDGVVEAIRCSLAEG